jgi:hypothetical protein
MTGRVAADSHHVIQVRGARENNLATAWNRQPLT